MYFSPNNLVSISNFYDAQAQAGSVQCMHFCFPQSEMSTNKVRVSVQCPQQGPDCPELCPASVQILSGVSGPSWRLCPARRTTVTTVQWLCRRPQRRCRQGEKSRGQISDQFSSISLLFCGYTAAAAGSFVAEVKFRKHSKWGYSRSGGRVFPP